MLIKVYPFSNLFHDWEYLIQCLKINYGIKRHLSFEAQNLEKIIQLRTKYDTGKFFTFYWYIDIVKQYNESRNHDTLIGFVLYFLLLLLRLLLFILVLLLS